jgi:predicted Zn-dependent peptidase
MRRIVFAVVVLAALYAAAAHAAAPGAIEIPYSAFTLDNGLRVIVHEDHKAPIVHVGVWYHVGSKDEPSGRSGFAHLFEHLMFEGTERVPAWDGPLEDIGGSNNGTTDFDRTNFYQQVPASGLDRVLWMEADRMATLAEAIDQTKLDTQRGVVQNEKRQRENQPYGLVWDRLFAALYPPGHPYRWLPIGSMEDLDAASLADVKDWFETWYGAANATLVIAGDVDTAAVKAKVQRYFGDLDAGPPLYRRGPWVGERDEATRDTMHDHVAQARLHRAYTMPGYTRAEADLLALFARVLGGGKTSRLYARLAYREQLVDGVSASTSAQEIGGQFLISADIKQGVDPARVEAILDEELAHLLAEGPSADELARAKTAFRADFVRALEAIDGKAWALAECALYTGAPDCYRESLARIERATGAQLRELGQRWLARGAHTLLVLPQPGYASAPRRADRDAGLPAVDAFPDARFPGFARARLDNGLTLLVAERHEIPVVQFSLQFDAGYAADQGRKPGTAAFTLAMLDEGAGGRDPLALAAAAEALGAQISTSSTLDTSNVNLSALTDQLEPSLALYADVVRRPQFAATEIERVRKLWLAAIAQEKTRPLGIALRVLPPLLYRPGHAYAIPMSGTGDEASVAALTRTDMVDFHRDWLRPDTATLIVVGDTTLARVRALIERRFGDWRAPATPRQHKNIAAVALPPAARVYLIDRPGAIQSVVIAGLVSPSSRAPNVLEIDTMNTVLGGLFSSRLNSNLREDKHWAYGAYSAFTGAVGQRPWIAYAQVQIDKTAEATAELARELRDYVGARPASAEEIARARNNDIRGLPAQFETSAAVLGAIGSIVRYGHPDDHIQTLKARLEAQTDDGVRAAAREVLHPDALTWVIVGDLGKIEAPIRALKLGEVQILDTDGRPRR